MKSLDLSVSSILYFKMFYHFRVKSIMLSQFPDPGMFMHSLNDQVKIFNCGFKHVVGIQTCGGDSGLSDLLNLFSHLKRDRELE